MVSPVAVLPATPAPSQQVSSRAEPSLADGRSKSYRIRGALIGSALLFLVGDGLGLNKALQHTDETLAVLPFKPMGSDSQDDYLQLGMADALIIKLSSVSRL